MEGRLRSRKEEAFDQGVAAAIGLGEEGDRLLSEVWPALRGWRRVAVAAAFGDVWGPAGGSVLRQALAVTGPGSQDLRCAALLALAKREGFAATADLVNALATSRDGVVRHYAVLGLAYAGDDRGWELVLHWLRALLRRANRPPSADPQAAFALTYLLRNAHDKPDRLRGIADVLRGEWHGCDPEERAWVAHYWPQALPDAPAATQVEEPDLSAVKAWIGEHPLFRHEGPPYAQEAPVV